MMKEIFNKVDYLSEAIGLLSHIADNQSYMELKSSLSTKRNITFETKSHIFDVLTKIEKAARKAFAGDKEEITYYFAVEEKAERSCGEVLVLWDGFGNEPYRTVEEFEKYFEEISEEDYIVKFGNYLQGYTNNIGDESSYEQLNEPIKIITYLMSMEVSKEEKWKLQTVFLNRKEHFTKIMDLIKRMIGFLEEYEKELNALVEEFYDYWSKTLENQTLREYMRKRIEFNLPDNPYGYRLRPSLMIPNITGIHIDTDENGNYRAQDEGWIGIIFGDEMDIISGEKEHVPDTRQILRALKLLSDKSKFEILCRINEESAYGSQLAKEMNLTAATISHHVNALMTEGLVTIQLKEKKVYYQPDKEKLKKILEGCMELLKL